MRSWGVEELGSEELVSGEVGEWRSWGVEKLGSGGVEE